MDLSKMWCNALDENKKTWTSLHIQLSFFRRYKKYKTCSCSVIVYSSIFLVQVLAIEFVILAIDFVLLANEFVLLANEFVPLAIEFVALAFEFIALARKFVRNKIGSWSEHENKM